MLLIDKEIRERCQGPQPMITPFSEGVSGNGVISWGLTSVGYDLRLGKKILLFKGDELQIHSVWGIKNIIDPKRFGEEGYTEKIFSEFTCNYEVILPPHSYVLGYSLEYLQIPDNIKGRCFGKSTLARSGILINTTPIEPSWRGLLTLEIGNITPCPAKIYIGEGICQLEFELLKERPEITYEDKKGIYQDQTDVTPPRVRE